MPKLMLMSYNRWCQRWTVEVWRGTAHLRFDPTQVAWPDPTRGKPQRLLALHVKWPSVGGKASELVEASVRQPVGWCLDGAQRCLVYKEMCVSRVSLSYVAPFYDLGAGYAPLILLKLGQRRLLLKLARDRAGQRARRGERVLWVPARSSLKGLGERKIAVTIESTWPRYDLLEVLGIDHGYAEWRTTYEGLVAVDHEGPVARGRRGEPVYTDRGFKPRTLGNLDSALRRNIEFCADHVSKSRQRAAEKALEEEMLSQQSGQLPGRHV